MKLLRLKQLNDCPLKQFNESQMKEALELQDNLLKPIQCRWCTVMLSSGQIIGNLFCCSTSFHVYHISPLSFPLLTTGISPVGLFAPLKRRVPPTDVSSHHFLYLLPPPLASLFLRRVMEWLRHVDLSEYAPNLRGSGVHGALLVMEKRSAACSSTVCLFLSCRCKYVAPIFVFSRFTAELLASLLSIPGSKSLLR